MFFNAIIISQPILSSYHTSYSDLNKFVASNYVRKTEDMAL